MKNFFLLALTGLSMSLNVSAQSLPFCEESGPDCIETYGWDEATGDRMVSKIIINSEMILHGEKGDPEMRIHKTGTEVFLRFKDHRQDIVIGTIENPLSGQAAVLTVAQDLEILRKKSRQKKIKSCRDGSMGFSIRTTDLYETQTRSIRKGNELFELTGTKYVKQLSSSHSLFKCPARD